MEGFRFSQRLRVRYSEIDGQKIVFNAHYLTYIDVAVIDYFEEVFGRDLEELAQENIFDIAMVKSTLEYKKPARFKDTLEIWCRTSRIGGSSLTMEFIITKAGEKDPLVQAEVIYVNYDAAAGKSRAIPDFVRQRIKEYEPAVSL